MKPSLVTLIIKYSIIIWIVKYFKWRTIKKENIYHIHLIMNNPLILSIYIINLIISKIILKYFSILFTQYFTTLFILLIQKILLNKTGLLT